jgi:NADH-quinone oxidoreductase subunit L
MFIAVGLGAYSSALFHVFTHAFFKALLFMGAGAVIVALHHEQNIFKMGKMRHVTPVVYMSMLIATLAISGIPPFAGFFSKDEILLVAFSSGEYLIWGIAVCSAVLTAYYMFRLFFVVFEGKNAKHAHHPHDVSWVMKAPLVVLAFGSLFAGFVGLPSLLGGSHLIGTWLGEWGMRATMKASDTWLSVTQRAM